MLRRIRFGTRGVSGLPGLHHRPKEMFAFKVAEGHTNGTRERLPANQDIDFRCPDRALVPLDYVQRRF
jgi:hypothetical protein